MLDIYYHTSDVLSFHSRSARTINSIYLRNGIGNISRDCILPHSNGGQLEKQGTGNGTGTGMGMGNGNGNLCKKMRRLVVEILFTNISRDDSVLAAILLMN